MSGSDKNNFDTKRIYDLGYKHGYVAGIREAMLIIMREHDQLTNKQADNEKAIDDQAL